MPSYSPCAFCGKTNSPRTREHIFADWIAREFPNQQWSRIEPATGKVVPFKNSLGLVSRKVCKDCNTGWMRQLEGTAKPVLVPLMHAHKDIVVTPDNQLLLTKWLIKTMLAYDLNAHRTRASVYTADERRSLASSLTVPEDTSVYLAQYRGTMGSVVTLESHMAPTAESLPKEYHHLLDTHGYTGTFVIKHLALQVFTFRRGKNLIGKNVDFAVPAAWNKAALQIWPISSATFNWPPPTLLDDMGLKRFASRWDGAGLIM